ncbi:MAG: hypothetical protein IJB58_08665 [Bacteroidales bacterium]|nr:hypothetical protein [Bacteroidales bacterium]
MKRLKILFVSLFVLLTLTTSVVSASPEYEPGFEYDHILLDTIKICDICGSNDWYFIDDKEYDMWIVVCMECAYWDFWVY